MAKRQTLDGNISIHNPNSRELIYRRCNNLSIHIKMKYPKKELEEVFGGTGAKLLMAIFALLVIGFLFAIFLVLVSILA